MPPRAAWWVCTVEAMPVDIGADFLAVDEIQLCGDPDRGHIFTDRLLHARGLHETLFLGAETMRPRIASLVPGLAPHPARALLGALLHRRPQDQPHAAAERHRRLLGRGRLRHRRAHPPPARRRGGGDGRALAPHPQRPGRALPERRRRLPRRHRRDRHGAEPRHQPRRLLRHGEVRRPPPPPPDALPSSPRSPGAPGASPPTAPSASPARPRPSIPRWSRRSRTTASRRSTACSGGARRSTSPARAR